MTCTLENAEAWLREDIVSANTHVKTALTDSSVKREVRQRIKLALRL